MHHSTVFESIWNNVNQRVYNFLKDINLWFSSPFTQFKFFTWRSLALFLINFLRDWLLGVLILRGRILWHNHIFGLLVHNNLFFRFFDFFKQQLWHTFKRCRCNILCLSVATIDYLYHLTRWSFFRFKGKGVPNYCS